MHILVLTDEIYPDAIGGVGKSLYNECAALVRRGIEVTVVVRGINHALPAQDTFDGIHIVRLFGPERSSPLYYFYPFSTIFSFTRWLRRSPVQFDLIQILNPLLILAARFSGANITAPLVYTFYVPMYREILIGVSGHKYGLLNPLAWVGAQMLRSIETRALRGVDAVMPRSRFSHDLLRELCPAAVVPEPLIPLGINTEVYAPHNRGEARKSLGLPADAPILLTVRRLAHRMGLQNLVAAMRMVRERFPDTHLFIAGKGPLREVLEEQISSLGLQDRVRLLGLISETDLHQYLASADLFILPTEFLEGFGLATLEALSSARPVIGTPNGATPELLARIDPELLTRDTHPQALADAVCYWLDRRETLPALEARCREEAQSRYNIDLVAEQLEARYRALADSKQAGSHKG